MSETVLLSEVVKVLDDVGGRDFAAYPAYQESGVDWLGKVPAQWSMMALRHLFWIVNGATPKSSDETCWGGDVAWVTPEDLGGLKSPDIFETGRTLTEEGYKSCGTTLVSPGSIILSTRAPIGHLAIATVPVCTNQGCRALAFSREGVSKYFYYLLLSAKQELQALGQGTTFLELGRNRLASVLLCRPPAGEQHDIATFLDRETARIDALIDKKQQLIDLLQEKRTALISQAVTKGLDPGVSMKDSDVVWLGEIPTHWEVKRLKFVVSAVKTGGTPSEEYFEDGDQLWFTPGDFNDTLTLTDSKRKIRQEAISDREVKQFPANSVLVIGIGATLGKVGYCTSACAANQQINVIVPKRTLNARFLTYALCSMTEVMRLVSNSTTLGIMNQDKTKQLVLALPPAEEQAEILENLDSEIRKIETICGKVAEAIKRLGEYRAAMISAAVTGKIDVRQGG